MFPYKPSLFLAHKRSIDDGYTGRIKKVRVEDPKAYKAKESGFPK